MVDLSDDLQTLREAVAALGDRYLPPANVHAEEAALANIGLFLARAGQARAKAIQCAMVDAAAKRDASDFTRIAVLLGADPERLHRDLHLRAEEIERATKYV